LQLTENPRRQFPFAISSFEFSRTVPYPFLCILITDRNAARRILRHLGLRDGAKGEFSLWPTFGADGGVSYTGHIGISF
jgi:hypothetical protein